MPHLTQHPRQKWCGLLCLLTLLYLGASPIHAQEWLGCIQTGVDERTDFPLAFVQNNCAHNVVAILCLRQKVDQRLIDYGQSIVGPGGSYSEPVYFKDRYEYAQAFACKPSSSDCVQGYLRCPDQ